jgi:hypothetical protein
MDADSLLKQYAIPDPCPMKWDDMDGDPRWAEGEHAWLLESDENRVLIHSRQLRPLSPAAFFVAASSGFCPFGSCRGSAPPDRRLAQAPGAG